MITRRIYLINLELNLTSRQVQCLDITDDEFSKLAPHPRDKREVLPSSVPRHLTKYHPNIRWFFSFRAAQEVLIEDIRATRQALGVRLRRVRSRSVTEVTPV